MFQVVYYVLQNCSKKTSRKVNITQGIHNECILKNSIAILNGLGLVYWTRLLVTTN